MEIESMAFAARGRWEQGLTKERTWQMEWRTRWKGGDALGRSPGDVIWERMILSRWWENRKDVEKFLQSADGAHGAWLKKMRIAAGETGRRFHDDLRPGLEVDDEAWSGRLGKSWRQAKCGWACEGGRFHDRRCSAASGVPRTIEFRKYGFDGLLVGGLKFAKWFNFRGDGFGKAQDCGAEEQGAGLRKIGVGAGKLRMRREMGRSRSVNSRGWIRVRGGDVGSWCGGFGREFDARN